MTDAKHSPLALQVARQMAPDWTKAPTSEADTHMAEMLLDLNAGHVDAAIKALAELGYLVVGTGAKTERPTPPMAQE